MLIHGLVLVMFTLKLLGLFHHSWFVVFAPELVHVIFFPLAILAAAGK